jgi:hypothetical protein
LGLPAGSRDVATLAQAGMESQWTADSCGMERLSLSNYLKEKGANKGSPFAQRFEIACLVV